MENQPAPATVTINWIITEETAQKVIECFDIVCKAGGLQNARIALPLAEDLMQTALKAKEAREAAAKAGSKPEEPTKN